MKSTRVESRTFDSVRKGKLFCAAAVLLSLAASFAETVLPPRAVFFAGVALLLVAVALTRLGASFWLSGLSAVAPQPIAAPERAGFLAGLFGCVAALIYGFVRVFPSAS